MNLDSTLGTKLKALNCAFTINGDLLTVEPGFTIKSRNHSTTKDLKKIEKLVKYFYPKAVFIQEKNPILGLKVYCQLN